MITWSFNLREAEERAENWRKIANNLEYENIILREEWDRLTNRINLLGGYSFLEKAEKDQNSSISLSQEDIRILILLCHPDKHGGKQIAQDMTAKLLSLRTK